MKKFAFPLERVMDWRRTLARIEEAKLEALYAQIRTINALKTDLNRERERHESALANVKSALGEELVAMDDFRKFTIQESTRLEVVRTECAKKVELQIQIVATKRRDVKLLERLKEHRLKTWTAELGREIDAQADEAYLSKWNTRA